MHTGSTAIVIERDALKAENERLWRQIKDAEFSLGEWDKERNSLYWLRYPSAGQQSNELPDRITP